MCNRYTYAKDKAFKRRSQGLSAKFAKGDGVTDFCTKFGNYLTEHGMDTIAYALNPNDPNEMVFLPEKYAICNINLAKVTPSATSLYLNSFDDLDRENDAAAKDALMNSITEELWTEVLAKHDKHGEPYLSQESNIIVIRTHAYDRQGIQGGHSAHHARTERQRGGEEVP